jgi:hypothetical protein
MAVKCAQISKGNTASLSIPPMPNTSHIFPMNRAVATRPTVPRVLGKLRSTPPRLSAPGLRRR